MCWLLFPYFPNDSGTSGTYSNKIHEYFKLHEYVIVLSRAIQCKCEYITSPGIYPFHLNV